MSDPEIDEAIAALRHAITRLDDDPESRARLDALADALADRHARDAPQGDGAARGTGPNGTPVRSGEPEPLDNAVLEMVQMYESRYPRVTLLLNDIAIRLANMGI